MPIQPRPRQDAERTAPTMQTIRNPHITAILDEILQDPEHKARKFGKDGSAIMPFNIDFLFKDSAAAPGAYRFAFSHYYRHDSGDMIADPDMEVLYFPEIKELAAMTFQDFRSYQTVQHGISGETELDDTIKNGSFGNARIDTRLQAQLNSFLKTWLKNVVEQQDLDSDDPQGSPDDDHSAGVKQFMDDIRAGKRDAKIPIASKLQKSDTGHSRLDLATFIERFKGPITANIHKRFTPIYDLSADTTQEDALIAKLQTRKADMPAPLFNAQEHITKAAKKLLVDHNGKCVFVIGEMGTGKTSCSNALAQIMQQAATRNLIVCPPHLVKKWEREIRETMPKQTRIQVFQIRTISDFEKAKQQAGLYEKSFFILSRERSKLSYYWKPSFDVKTVTVMNPDTRQLENVEMPYCPNCHEIVTDPRTGAALEARQLRNKKHWCQNEYPEIVQAGDNTFTEKTRKCNTPLWTADPGGPRRYALADYIAKRNKNFFDVLVIDECFPGNTPISTPTGEILIKDIHPGDIVLSYRDGTIVQRRVNRTIKRQSHQPFVKIAHEQGFFNCTPHHKIYTQRGYVAAIELQKNDSLIFTAGINANYSQKMLSMSGTLYDMETGQEGNEYLREGLRNNSESKKPHAENSQIPEKTSSDMPILPATIFRTKEKNNILQQELQPQSNVDEPIKAENAKNREAEKSCIRENEKAQSRSCNKSENDRQTQGALILRDSRGERTAYHRAITTCESFGMAHRVFDTDGKLLVESRDGRHCKSNVENCDRMRRIFTPHREAEKQGPNKREDVERSGMDSHEILEFGDNGKPQLSPVKNTTYNTSRILSVAYDPQCSDDFVYDLEIEDTHCYFAAGVLVSNCHEMKSRGSAQGQVIGTLAGACKKTVALTGTIFGGRSSSLFYLLYRFSPAFKKQFKYTEEAAFVKKYGIQWTIKRETESTEDGRSSKRKNSPTRIEEKPGISPEIILHLIDKAVFINLKDISDTLPAYQEMPIEVQMTGHQAAEYYAMEKAFRAKLAKALAKGDKKLLSVYLQTCLTFPDLPGDDPDELLPKEKALIDFIQQEKQQGRKTLVYCTHTDTRDITPRLKYVLQKSGIKTEVMKATVKAEKREDWIKDKTKAGIDVLICNPSLVKTGLDLIDFPNIVNFEIDFNIYTTRQASRRSWRIGQTEAVKVLFMCYSRTMQERALALVAKKLKAAEMLDGDLQADGLSGFQDEGSILVDLAKSMLSGIQEEQTLQGIFNSKSEAEADTFGFIGQDMPATVKAPEPGQILTTPADIEPQKTPTPGPADQPDLWDFLYAAKLEDQATKAKPRARTAQEQDAELILRLF